MASERKSRNHYRVREFNNNLAIEAAVALAGNSGLAHLFRVRPLPEGVREVLVILADQNSSNVTLDVRHKLENYVLQVLLYRGAPPHRLLGVNQGVTRQEMRTNMALLMRWLHPDSLGEGGWRSAYAPRVLNAWKELSSKTDNEVASDRKEHLPRQCGDGNITMLVSSSERRNNSVIPLPTWPRASSRAKSGAPWLRAKGTLFLVTCTLLGFGYIVLQLS